MYKKITKHWTSIRAPQYSVLGRPCWHSPIFKNGEVPIKNNFNSVWHKELFGSAK